jgi:hypothetical protein
MADLTGRRRGRTVASTWRSAALGLTLAGACTSLVGAFSGWVRSGARVRSSFATLRSARTLGVLHGTAAQLAPLWFLLPVAVGLVFLAVGLRRWRLAGALSLLVGAGALLAVVAVQRSPLPTRPGVWVTAVGGVLALLGGASLIVRASLDCPRKPRK